MTPSYWTFHLDPTFTPGTRPDPRLDRLMALRDLPRPAAPAPVTAAKAR